MTDLPAADLHYSGVQTATLTIHQVSANDAGDYRCMVTDDFGSTPSAYAPLTIGVPTITGQPADQNVCAGVSATFSVAATGSPPLTYQWQVSTNGGVTWSNVFGATIANYTFTTATSDNGKKYRCVITSACGSVTSNPATLIISTPNITAQPANVTVCSDSTATFSVTATNATSYQWQVSTDWGSTWSDVAGATASVLTFATAPTDNYKQFRCCVSNGCTTTCSN